MGNICSNPFRRHSSDNQRYDPRSPAAEERSRSVDHVTRPPRNSGGQPSIELQRLRRDGRVASQRIDFATGQGLPEHTNEHTNAVNAFNHHYGQYMQIDRNNDVNEVFSIIRRTIRSIDTKISDSPEGIQLAQMEEMEHFINRNIMNVSSHHEHTNAVNAFNHHYGQYMKIDRNNDVNEVLSTIQRTIRSTHAAISDSPEGIQLAQLEEMEHFIKNNFYRPR